MNITFVLGFRARAVSLTRALVLLATLLVTTKSSGQFLTTSLDSNSFTRSRITDPAGTTTYVADILVAHASGNNSEVPIGENVAVNVTLPPGQMIRVLPGARFDVDLLLGARAFTSGVLANVQTFSGALTLNATGLSLPTLSLPFFNEAITQGETKAFMIGSQFFQSADTATPVLISGFEFTFNVGAVGLLNSPPLIADELQVALRAFKFVPNAQVSTQLPIVTLVPEPATSAKLGVFLVAVLLGFRGFILTSCPANQRRRGT